MSDVERYFKKLRKMLSSDKAKKLERAEKREKKCRRRR